MADSMKKEIKDILGNLKKDGVLGIAVVDKEGEVLQSDLPNRVHKETFGIMSATIIGASGSANSELGRGSVDIATVDSDEGNIFMANTTADLIICLITDKTVDMEDMSKDLHTAVDRINALF